MTFKKFRTLKRDFDDDRKVRREYHMARRRFAEIFVEKPDLSEEDKTALVKDYVELDNAEWSWEAENSDYYYKKGWTHGYIVGLLGAITGLVLAAVSEIRKKSD